MKQVDEGKYISLDTSEPIWEHFMHVAPLVVIGSRGEDGYNLAPKHMVTPLGWKNYFGFVCTPRHRTYTNIRDTGVFSVSYPKPDQLIYASLAAAAREPESGEKPVMEILPHESGKKIDAPVLVDAGLIFECELDRIVDDFGENSLISGKIVAARVQSGALRISERSIHDVLAAGPLLVYLHPGAFSVVETGYAFPFPKRFEK